MRGWFLKTLAVVIGLLLGIPGAHGFGGEIVHHDPRIGVSRHSLDDVADTLREDTGVLGAAMRYPDVYGDDYRNQRFQAPQNCTLIGVLMAFATHGFQRWTTGDPSLVVIAWPMGSDSFPDLNHAILSDTVPFSVYSASVYSTDSAWHNWPSQFVAVDLSGYHVALDSAEWFHVGYTAVRNSADDSLAILVDGSTTSNLSSEYYQGHFVPMSAAWTGLNFMIRPIVNLPSSGTAVLEPDGGVRSFDLHPAFPNPFNPKTTVSFDLTHPQMVRVTVLDILGRERAEPAREMFGVGRHQIVVNGTAWSSGVYFVRVETGKHSQALRIVLEK